MTAHEEAVQRHARVLKAMIWGMGVLLAAAAVVVVAMIVKAVNPPPSGIPIPPGLTLYPPMGPDSPPAQFGLANLPVPVGCKIEQMTVAGYRLILALEGDAECPRIVIANMSTGQLIGQFQFSGK